MLLDANTLDVLLYQRAVSPRALRRRGTNMTWAYRVMRKRWQRGRKWGYTYGIHEYYGTIGGKGAGWTCDPMEPSGDTLAELKSDYEYMAEAFKHPVLDYETGKPIRGRK